MHSLGSKDVHCRHRHMMWHVCMFMAAVNAYKIFTASTNPTVLCLTHVAWYPIPCKKKNFLFLKWNSPAIESNKVFFSSTSFCFTFAVWQTHWVNLSWKFDNSSFSLLASSYFLQLDSTHACMELLIMTKKRRKRKAKKKSSFDNDTRWWCSSNNEEMRVNLVICLHRSFDGAIPYAHEKMKKFNNFFCVCAVVVLLTQCRSSCCKWEFFRFFPLCRVLPSITQQWWRDDEENTRERHQHVLVFFVLHRTCKLERINLSLTESKFIITK